MGHDMCEAMGVSAIVCADFVDGAISFGKLKAQCDVRIEACKGVLGIFQLVGEPTSNGLGDQDLHWLWLEIMSLAC